MNEFFEFILIHYLMSNFNFSDCKKAVNQTTPSVQPQSVKRWPRSFCKKLWISSLTSEEVKEDKPKAKKRRRKAKADSVSADS